MELLVLSVAGFLGGSDGKESACYAGDLGLTSGLGRSPGEGHGNPLQYCGLENSTEATVHGVTRVQLDLATTPPPPLYREGEMTVVILRAVDTSSLGV